MGSPIQPDTTTRRLRVALKRIDKRLRLRPAFCKRCGRDVQDYTAPTEVSQEIESDIAHGSVLCYACFCEACAERGLPSTWALQEVGE